MKNNIIYKYKSKVKIKVVGKNIERFIKRLKSNHIELLKIEYIKYNEINILIYKEDYEKIVELKTIYDISLLDFYGIIKIQKLINLNKFLLLFVFLGIMIIIFLSNVIFKIEVVYNDSEMRKLILNELEINGIKTYTFKKDYNELQSIKQNILNKYPNKIEWLEIEVVGTKYVIRLQERLIIDNNQEKENNHIIATKDAIIKNVIAKEGEIVKEINEHVKKGDIVISGNISLNEEIKETKGAKGTVYGEVWYETTVTYPLIYSEIKETGNYQNKIVLKLFNKTFEFGNKYKDKKIKEEPLLKHNFLPIGLYKQEQSEVNTISLVLTYEQAIDKALELSKEKMEINLKEEEYIISSKVLKTNINNDKVELKMFYAIYEDISGYETIKEVD